MFYSLGAFVDDYARDEEFRNDLSFVTQVTFSAAQTRGEWRIRGVRILPTRIYPAETVAPAQRDDRRLVEDRVFQPLFRAATGAMIDVTIEPERDSARRT